MCISLSRAYSKIASNNLFNWQQVNVCKDRTVELHLIDFLYQLFPYFSTANFVHLLSQYSA